MEAEVENPEDGSKEDNAKRTRSPQGLPNQNRRKKQSSFMNMELEDYLEAEVREMGLEMALLDGPAGNTTPTLNKTAPPLQHCVLLGVPVKNINTMEVKQNGGLINSQAMGASLAILENLLIPQLIQNNNPNSQVQHVLISPIMMKSILITFTGINKNMRKNVSGLLNLPAVASLTKEEYQLRELNLQIPH